MLKGIIEKVIAGIILYGVFQPDIFKKGVHDMDWYLVLRIVIFIAVIWYLFWKQESKFVLKEEIKDFNTLKIKRTDHFYTINEEERNKAINDYKYKIDNPPIACYVLPVDKDGKLIPDAKPVPLYRLWAE
jgi:hypothetical protein